MHKHVCRGHSQHWQAGQLHAAVLSRTCLYSHQDSHTLGFQAHTLSPLLDTYLLYKLRWLVSLTGARAITVKLQPCELS
jgi:hypothetical protein